MLAATAKMPQGVHPAQRLRPKIASSFLTCVLAIHPLFPLLVLQISGHSAVKALLAAQLAACSQLLLLTINVIDCEGWSKVCEHAGKDTPRLNPNEGDRGLVGVADLIDALALFKAGICQHNHLQARMHACRSDSLPCRQYFSCWCWFQKEQLECGVLLLKFQEGCLPGTVPDSLV